MTEVKNILLTINGSKKIKPLSDEELEANRVKNFNSSAGDLNEADGYNCTECNNKGLIAMLNNNGQMVCRQCKCSKIRGILIRAKRSGLGDILKEFTFDTFRTAEQWQQDIKDIARAFIKDDASKWFYIGGQVGCGKSHICTAIAAHYIKQGKETRYMLWAEDAKKLKAVVNDESYQNMMNEFKRADVLYIDDFLKTKGGETPTNADINIAFEIINNRLMDNNKITIISSEKIIDDVIDYDEATMSRIYQKTGNYKISIGKDRAKNYRLRG